MAVRAAKARSASGRRGGSSSSGRAAGMGSGHGRRGAGSSSSRRGVGSGRVVKRSSRESAREQVVEIQRARVFSAAASVVAELGYGGMNVARVASRAGVSRRTFYELFEDREDCFLELFDDALARATRVVHDACSDLTVVSSSGREDGWRGQVRTGLGALLGLIDDEPELGSLLIVGALGGGPRVLERRAGMIETLIAIVDEGRGEARGGHEPPPLTAEGIVGAVLSVLHARMLEQATDRAVGLRVSGSSRSRNAGGAPGSLIGLLNPLMGMIVLPYLGRAAAKKELARPIPKAPRASKSSGVSRSSPSGDPLRGLQMRLTYRTLRVLSAIASEPAASNRQVAQTAGVHDQGQISKLLGRLERLGLIQNTGNGQPRGEPNAWTLTPRGQEVEQALRI